jgi:hypothetical protein
MSLTNKYEEVLATLAVLDAKVDRKARERGIRMVRHPATLSNRKTPTFTVWFKGSDPLKDNGECIYVKDGTLLKVEGYTDYEAQELFKLAMEVLA